MARKKTIFTRPGNSNLIRSRNRKPKQRGATPLFAGSYHKRLPKGSVRKRKR